MSGIIAAALTLLTAGALTGALIRTWAAKTTAHPTTIIDYRHELISGALSGALLTLIVLIVLTALVIAVLLLPGVTL